MSRGRYRAGAAVPQISAQLVGAQITSLCVAHAPTRSYTGTWHLAPGTVHCGQVVMVPGEVAGLSVFFCAS